MHSFTTFPVFMNALSLLLLFSLVGDAFSAAVANRIPGYYGFAGHDGRHMHTHNNHHNHNHIPAGIKGYPAMPSVSSKIFTYGKIVEYLRIGEVYLKDVDEGRGSTGPQLVDDRDGSRPDHDGQAAADYHNNLYGFERPQHGSQQGLAPNHTTAQETTERLKESSVPSSQNTAGSTVSLLRLTTAIRSFSFSNLETSLKRLINAHSFLPSGMKTKQEEAAFGEEDFSLLISDYLWT